MRFPLWRSCRPLFLALALPVQAVSPDEAAAFRAWEAAVDTFLAQPERFSQFSDHGRLSRYDPVLAPEARFERLCETLPPASQWGRLTEGTRARLPERLPRTTEEARAWLDAHLIHLWALVLRYPESRVELPAILDRLRTVRWMLENDQIPGDRGLGQRLGSVEKGLRAFLAGHDGSADRPPEQVFAKALRDASRPLREVALEELGEERLKALEEIADARQSAEALRRADIDKYLSDSHAFSGTLEVLTQPDLDAETRARLVQEADARQAAAREAGEALDRAKEQADARVRRLVLEHPEDQALFDYGPLPESVRRMLHPEERESSEPLSLVVPDLVAECSEERALELLVQATKTSAELDWTRSGRTMLAAARWVAAGRLPMRSWDAASLMELIVSGWSDPAEEQAKAVLALTDWMEAHAADEDVAHHGRSLAESLAAWRALAHVVLGEPERVPGLDQPPFDQGLGWNEWAALPASCDRSLFHFLQRYLEANPSAELSHWELLQRVSARAGLAAEALALIRKHEARLAAREGFRELRAQARVDAGGAEAASELLATLARPLTKEAPVRTEAILRLHGLGVAEGRPEWCKAALSHLAQLLAFHTRGKGKSPFASGADWERLPGWLAGLQRLDLAREAAELNVRWTYQHEKNLGTPEPTEERPWRLWGVASAKAGLAQVMLLQKQPRAVLDLLEKRSDWFGRDLADVLEYADPSFPEADRLPLGESAARALALLGRDREAAAIRAALVARRWPEALARRLEEPRFGPEERIMLRSILGPVTLPEGAQEPSYTVLAGALEKLDLPAELWDAPERLLPLKAAAARQDAEHEDQFVPVLRTRSFRAFILARLLDLECVREALLDNVR